MFVPLDDELLDELRLAEGCLEIDTASYEVKFGGVEMTTEAADDLMDRLLADDFVALRTRIWVIWNGEVRCLDKGVGIGTADMTINSENSMQSRPQ